MRGERAGGDLFTNPEVGRWEAELQALKTRLLEVEREITRLKERIELLQGASNVGAAPCGRPSDATEAVPGSRQPAELGQSIDQAIGRGFSLAAVIALVLAVGFLARLGFGRGSAFALLAVAAGCGALVVLASVFRQRRQVTLSLWMEGGAVGVGYLSAYAAFSAWHSLPAALAAALAVTGAGTAVSLARRSQAIAVFAVLGAVLTPLLMRSGVETVGPGSTLLFAYLALLNLNVLLLSRLRDWPWQAASSLLATHFLAWLWYAELARSGEPDPRLALLFSCATFLVFLLRPLVMRKRSEGWLEKAMTVVNAALFLAALHTLLSAYAPAVLPFAPLAVGVVYAAAAPAFGGRTALTSTHLTLATVLIVPGAWYALPAWAALIWSGVGAVLGVIGFRWNHWLARMAACALIAAALLATPRAYAAVPAVAAGVWYLLRAWRQLPHPGDFEWVGRWGLAVALLLGILAATTVEVRNLLARPAMAALAPGAQFFYSLTMALYAGCLAVWKPARAAAFFRACGLALFGALTLKVFFLDLAILPGAWRIGSLLLLAGSLLAIAARRR
jgi:hypothetical protein